MATKLIARLLYSGIYTNAVVFASLTHAATTTSSLEQYNYQTGDSTLTVRSYDAFDEYHGPIDINGVSGVNGLSVAINGGTATTIAYNPQYETFKQSQSWNNVDDMIAARPVDATYTHTLSGMPAGAVTITAPGHAYADAIPVNPLFTISGVNGTWSINSEGTGVFTFDPSSVTSFTMSMNRYSESNRLGFQQGGHYAYGLVVADLSSGYTPLGGLSSGLIAESTLDEQFTVTFTQGLTLDAGDNDDSTYGFTPGSFFEIEGEFVNIFNFAATTLGDTTVEHGFIYQTVTSVLIQAAPIPEPETYAMMLAGLGLVGWSVRRRKLAKASVR